MSPAAQTLGLGDEVKQQLEDDLEERKKKLLQASKVAPTGAGAASTLGLAGSY